MATLYKHGDVIADYTRYIKYSNGQRLGYIFRQMSDDWTLIRSALPGRKWRLYRKHEAISKISQQNDAMLINNIAHIFG